MSFTIKDIENLTEETAEKLCKEKMEIKGFNCYFIDFPGVFGYSVIAFFGGRMIKYANEYALHYHGQTEKELRIKFIAKMAKKLFLDEEITDGPVNTYEEYQRKMYYLINLWPLKYGYFSMFHIGDYSKEERREMKKYPYPSYVCHCFFKDEELVRKAQQMYLALSRRFIDQKEKPHFFREMVSYELANHEAGYTGMYEDGLSALGLRYEELSDWQQKIVKEELGKQEEACWQS